MALTKTRMVAAVDVGSSKIATLIAQINVDQTTFETSVNIVGAATSASRGIKKGQIVNIEEAVEATIVSVEAAERMAGYNLDSAYISVGGGHISSQNSTGVVAVSDPEGEISAGDVERVIEAAQAVSLPTSRQIIHSLPREYMVDGEVGIRDPIGMTGVRLEVNSHLVTASSAALKNLTKALGEVGIDVGGAIFAGLASATAVLSNTEKELGCVLIDIGGGMTSVAAFVDSALAYSGTIPIGAKNVTNDLAIGLRVSLDSAEMIKTALSARKKETKGSDKLDIAELGAKEAKKVSRRTLVEGIIRPRLNEIFTMVRLDLERVGLANKIPSGAVVTGGGALTIGAQEAAKRMLLLPVRVGKPRGVGGLIDDVIDPIFSTAVGLILFGVGREPESHLSGITKKFKIPAKGTLGKLFGTIRDLLP